jgi:hypothetical protein
VESGDRESVPVSVSHPPSARTAVRLKAMSVAQ